MSLLEDKKNSSKGVNYDRKSTARLVSNVKTKAATQYTRRYLQKNKLFMYLDGFVRLDNIINLFFINYGKLKRSSLNCARLWVAVMKCRTQMTNAITHLVDQQRYITFEYKNLRIKELNDHIYNCRIFVAKAVQYIVTFSKHEDEEWRFLRKGFLSKFSINLSDWLTGATKAWTEFIIDAYELEKHTADAYRNHLIRQEFICRHALKTVEPRSQIAKSNSKLSDRLDKMFGARKEPRVQKEDYYQLRVLLNSVEDCVSMESEIVKMDGKDISAIEEESAYEEYANEEGYMETIDSVKNFLKKKIPRVVEMDDKVWPHQMGLDDLGPFQLVDLPNPEEFIEVKEENGKTFYKMKGEYAKVRGLGMFKNQWGKVNVRSAVTLSKKSLTSLRIPSRSETFAWFFPVYPDANCPTYPEDNEAVFHYANDLSPLHVFLLYGGFGYYDKDGKLISVKGVTMGDDLFFDGPYFIPNERVYEELDNNGVPFEKVTLAPLKAMDAESFGWINPGQDVPFHVQDGGSVVKGWKFNGAFAYRYDNSNKPPEFANRRNYFQILTFQEVDMKRQKNSNTPAVASLRILYNKYKRDWIERETPDDEFSNQWTEDVFESVTALNTTFFQN